MDTGFDASNYTSTDTSTDTAARRLSVAQAAEALGISQDAVYKRIKRGSIPWDHGGDGKTYVYLKQDASTSRGEKASTDESSDASGAARDELLGSLKDQIDTLKAELADWKEEARRKDHLLAAALERIPAIEAPPEPRNGHETPSEGPGGADCRPADKGAHEGTERRSWWRRLFE